MSPKTIVALMMFTLSIGVLSGANHSALAGIIKWKDDQGKVHFTNDISKVPKKFRDQGKMEKLRGVPTSRVSSPPAKNVGQEKKDDEILSKEDIGKIQTAKRFLKREMQFAKAENTTFHMPTSLRAFGKKFTALNSDREKVKNQIDGTQVPSLQKVAKHIEANLAAAKANPNWMRKLSAANTIKRVKTEVSANPGLIKELEQAVEISRQKEKEKKEKEKEDKKGAKGKK